MIAYFTLDRHLGRLTDGLRYFTAYPLREAMIWH
jgi:hypothetical protein